MYTRHNCIQSVYAYTHTYTHTDSTVRQRLVLYRLVSRVRSLVANVVAIGAQFRHRFRLKNSLLFTTSLQPVWPTCSKPVYVPISCKYYLTHIHHTETRGSKMCHPEP